VRWGLGLLPGLAVVLFLALAPSALAISAPIQIANTGGQGVFIRPQPNTSQPAVGWMAEGTSPDYNCWTQGQNVNGVDVWFNVNHSGVTGYYASYYDNSSYAHDSDITAKYGIPQCGAAPPPPQPAASISAAVGGVYGCGSCHSLDIAVHNFPTGTFTYYCHDNSGPGGSDTVFYSHAVSVTDPNQSTWPGVFCYDSGPYTAYLVMNGVTSNSVSFGSSPPPVPGPASITASLGGQYGCGSCNSLDIAVHNFPTGTFTYECHDNSAGQACSATTARRIPPTSTWTA
jgi:hypothetical protein